jgi:hypothetical protein
VQLRSRRRFLWITFGVLLIATFLAITWWIVWVAVTEAGAVSRALAAFAWVAAFGVSWRAFRGSHGDENADPATNEGNRPKRWVRWLQGAWVYGLVAAGVVAMSNFSNATQIVFLAAATGFMWPATYWIVRAYVKHPELRERLLTRSPLASARE